MLQRYPLKGGFVISNNRPLPLRKQVSIQYDFTPISNKIKKQNANNKLFDKNELLTGKK